MPRATPSDICYGLRHPLQALRYLRYRDTISYEICARYLPANPVIVEAGAYDGSNSRDFCLFWPDCKVYAFEPVPSAYERLLRVSSEFPKQIYPQCMALGRHSRISEMHVSCTGTSGGEQSSSLLAPTATKQEFPSVAFGEQMLPVRVRRLDEWAAEMNVSCVDFLWLDLQGMELAALQGCGDLLAKTAAIHCEVQHFALYKGAVLYPELYQWLRNRGFKIAREAVFRRGGNVLFVRST